MNEYIIHIAAIVLLTVGLCGIGNEGLLVRGVYAGELQKGTNEDAGELVKKAKALYAEGKYEEAIPLAEKALEMNEKALGKDNALVGENVQILAQLYHADGRYEEAEPLFLRALDMTEKKLGKDHPDVARILNDFGLLLCDMSEYERAMPLFERALKINEKTSGMEHPDTAQTFTNLASLYHATGKYTEAESFYKKGLEIREKTSGKDHKDVAESLNNLAALYRATARFAEAEPLYKRALEIDEKLLGAEHPSVAIDLNNLAALYRVTGRYVEAEPLYKRTLEIDKKVYGQEHPDVATDMNNLAVLYRDTGRYAEAEPLHKRALAIDENILGNDHPYVATDLANLAALYYDTGRYELAEPEFKRALAIYENVFGKEHPRVSQNLNNMVKLYHAMGKNAEAEKLCKRALAIDEKVLGDEHPNLAMGLSNLAVIYHDTGRYEQAEPLFKRALDIRQKAFGKDNPRVAQSLNNLARLYAGMQKHAESNALYIQGMQIEDAMREDVFSLLSERQKLTYMEQKQRTLYEFMCHTSRFMKDNVEAVSNALNIWLRWKGAVMEAQGRYIDAVTASADPIIRQKFNELRKIRMQLAKLQMVKPDKLSSDDYKRVLKELSENKGVLEAELSRLSKEYAFEKRVGKADIETISALLPEQSAYIDYARIDQYDFQKQEWGKAHYIAFLMIPHVKEKPVVKLIDIAEAEELESHIKIFLKEMKKVFLLGRPGKDVLIKKEAKILYSLLMKPVETYLETKTQLFISPDGYLHLLPFEILMTEDERYLIETYQINYVSAGRDIIRFEDTTTAEGAVVLMGDPDYDLGQAEKVQATGDEGKDEQKIRGVLSGEVSGMEFPRLPETKQEIDAIEKIIEENYHLPVKNYQDKQALEDVLFKIESPRMLHLATHGYFLPNEEVTAQDKKMLSAQEMKATVDIGLANPMTRSALVLAGANTSIKEGRDDGIVSAEKVLSLRLRGTELVVLSACETGLGDVKNGEGVFGLKRAFILAGAKTIVMSLWSVPSAETTQLMTNFYDFMSQGKGKAQSLREAKLRMLRDHPNPFYWAAFLLTGEEEGVVP
ncbi:MAG: hypothetical protein A2Y62_18345 [Candidatus Fischerbacteria bacterium RBG_13_37_8]|uniref:CHAT domain-containing protein n=1 Tax=Candidatus Fischerbacteria bacterium RBG_13_37_8 TaxID=1817863 RepID=A0A1F5VXA5_9BACT|nr:MAG: hypothetical protein A2Y62_18345 [Candidatus Fischerbacteria bacterium RBG_13_37_8]